MFHSDLIPKAEEFRCNVHKVMLFNYPIFKKLNILLTMLKDELLLVFKHGKRK